AGHSRRRERRAARQSGAQVDAPRRAGPRRGGSVAVLELARRTRDAGPFHEPLTPLSMARRALLLLCILLPGCRRDVPRLDGVAEMAYGVKPGVVRISAFA